ncbi:MAG: Crp/Fnr family transcriptional regulator [Peptococcaceae bacterium]|nr:Crp/Fnr family transcriptional regulator [Peptococcaceae bacterium]
MGKDGSGPETKEPRLLDHEKEIIRSIGSRVEFGKGQVIFGPGDCGGKICLIESGSVGIYRLTGEGRQVVEGVRKSGELMGLAEAFCGIGRTCYKGAIDDVVLVSVLKEDFHHLLACNPFFLKKILQMLAYRMRVAEPLVYDMIFRRSWLN